MSEVEVIGSFKAQPGKEVEALEAFKALVEPSHTIPALGSRLRSPRRRTRSHLPLRSSAASGNGTIGALRRVVLSVS